MFVTGLISCAEKLVSWWEKMTGMQERWGCCTSSWIRADGATVSDIFSVFIPFIWAAFLCQWGEPLGDEHQDLIQDAKVFCPQDEKGKAYRSKAAVLAQEDFSCRALQFSSRSWKTLIIPSAAYVTFTQPGWTLPSVCSKGVTSEAVSKII